MVDSEAVTSGMFCQGSRLDIVTRGKGSRCRAGSILNYSAVFLWSYSRPAYHHLPFFERTFFVRRSLTI